MQRCKIGILLTSDLIMRTLFCLKLELIYNFSDYTAVCIFNT